MNENWDEIKHCVSQRCGVVLGKCDKVVSTGNRAVKLFIGIESKIVAAVANVEIYEANNYDVVSIYVINDTSVFEELYGLSSFVPTMDDIECVIGNSGSVCLQKCDECGGLFECVVYFANDEEEDDPMCLCFCVDCVFRDIQTR